MAYDDTLPRLYAMTIDGLITPLTRRWVWSAPLGRRFDISGKRQICRVSVGPTVQDAVHGTRTPSERL